MTVHITLYSGKADRFEEIKAELADELGYEPSNPEVIGHMMMEWSDEGSTRTNRF